MYENEVTWPFFRLLCVRGKTKGRPKKVRGWSFFKTLIWFEPYKVTGQVNSRGMTRSFVIRPLGTFDPAGDEFGRRNFGPERHLSRTGQRRAIRYVLFGRKELFALDQNATKHHLIMIRSSDNKTYGERAFNSEAPELRQG